MSVPERVRFAVVMTEEGVDARHIEEVLLAAEELHALAERECSDESYGPADVARTDQLEAHVVAVLRPYNIVPAFQGDPRGAVVRLRLPSGRANDWGGEGFWCVP